MKKEAQGALEAAQRPHEAVMGNYEGVE